MRRESELLEIRLARKVDHRRWTAHQNDRIVGCRMQICTNHLIADKALAVRPSCDLETKIQIR